MQRRLILLKRLAKLYQLQRFGAGYFQNEPIAQGEDLPQDPKRLAAMISRCHLCPLVKLRKNAMIGVGAMRRRIMIVVEEPSAREDETGRWFCGSSGETLKNIIERGMALSLDDVYVAAAIRCHSFGRADDSAFISCRGYLVAEIERLQPKVVIALGKRAFNALCGGDETIEAARGRLWSCAFDRAMVVPSYSLGYMRLNQRAKKETALDLKLALDFIDR
jgi:DNA polymerase